MYVLFCETMMVLLPSEHEKTKLRFQVFAIASFLCALFGVIAWHCAASQT